MPADFTCTFKIRCLWNSGHILPPLLIISLGKISWFDLETTFVEFLKPECSTYCIDNYYMQYVVSL